MNKKPHEIVWVCVILIMGFLTSINWRLIIAALSTLAAVGLCGFQLGKQSKKPNADIVYKVGLVSLSCANAANEEDPNIVAQSTIDFYANNGIDSKNLTIDLVDAYVAKVYQDCVKSNLKKTMEEK